MNVDNITAQVTIHGLTRDLGSAFIAISAALGASLTLPGRGESISDGSHQEEPTTEARRHGGTEASQDAIAGNEERNTE
jgi:hypothetical protein